MMRDSGAESAIDQAARRLERALALLEQRLTDRLARSSAEIGGLFDQDRSKLADELDAARARQRELEAAGLEASEALGEAIAEIDAVLSQVTETGDVAEIEAQADDEAAAAFEAGPGPNDREH
ncbi:MAG: DUF4164 family protein [Pseudomonadota bacterium]|jgi:predicted  nucleic acid-binding Zn-ribbon protein